MRVWIDIDNPPQARCMLPLVRRFEEAGHDVLLTARAYGETFAILRNEAATFEPIGASFGKGAARKVYGLLKRTRQLTAFLERQSARPDLVLTGSRSAPLAARQLGIPSFVIIDYEYVDLRAYRLAGSCVLHPNVIDSGVLERRGIRANRLMPFDGLKEDIAFADVDLFAVPRYEFDDGGDTTPRVLFRPPAEESHYYRSASRDLALEFLRFLAAQSARIVFSPRYSRQVGYLDEVSAWQEEPIILRDPVPSVALLKGVDVVVSAGGTMLREAAFLGVPAYSIFRGSIGAVDRFLASIGRLSVLKTSADFPHIELARKTTISPLRSDASTTADDLIQMILHHPSGRNNESRGSAVHRPTAAVRREFGVRVRRSFSRPR